MATNTETETPTPPISRRPKSELDREIKLMRQIESRWRQLSRRSRELVVELLAADLNKQEEPSDD